ncbi:hypothetical protein [Streptomyces sulphureus]|uniref:hypothetical protein n=1 Tax=Streptomyces sulphureus TaxID=47758 RepID=UPI000360106F|nr:hypothetical protein [Streptomyces sulphureus]
MAPRNAAVTAAAGAARSGCPRCGAPIWRQLVGRRAALMVSADDDPMPLADALPHTGPNRLAWRVRRLHGGGCELHWLHLNSPVPAAVEVVLDHQCPPEDRPPEALW